MQIRSPIYNKLFFNCLPSKQVSNFYTGLDTCLTYGLELVVLNEVGEQSFLETAFGSIAGMTIIIKIFNYVGNPMFAIECTEVHLKKFMIIRYFIICYLYHNYCNVIL